MFLFFLITAVLSFHLDERSRIVFACDYTNPITSMRLQNSMLPCSTLYTPILTAMGLKATANVTSILESDTLSPVAGFLCYKLVLITRCTQKWFQSNQISRFTETEDVDQTECLSGNTCVGCEIANEYQPEDCRVFTFGQNDVRKTVIFKSRVAVHVDRLGTYYYNGVVSPDGVFSLGGDYRSRVFSEPHDIDTYQTVEQYYFNRDTMTLVSLERKRIYIWSGSEVTYDSQTWLVFDKNNYMLKSDLLPSSRILKSSGPNQAYHEFFLSAHLNVTNWRLDYLDCRLKNLVMNSNDLPSSLDLGVGEVYSDGYVYKYPCKSISTGTIIGVDRCLVLDLDGDKFNISSSGEATNNHACSSSMRINSTHVLNLNSAGVVVVDMYSYPSLQEEETILNHPPTATFDKSEIMQLIRASSIYNANKRGSGQVVVVNSGSAVASSPFLDSLFWRLVFLSTSIIVFIHLCGQVYIFINNRFLVTRVRSDSDSNSKNFELKI